MKVDGLISSDQGSKETKLSILFHLQYPQPFFEIRCIGGYRDLRRYEQDVSDRLKCWRYGAMKMLIYGQTRLEVGGGGESISC
jgi:hypothetical protein